jgi:hypothetical protein
MKTAKCFEELSPCKCLRCLDHEEYVSTPLQPTTGKHQGEWSFVIFYVSEKELVFTFVLEEEVIFFMRYLCD